ncbi:MAG: hypothetical protein PHI40_08630, partial [Caldisericia bacterium]|nr:hypothetical protein [Caldisericia bacterium]
PIRINSIHRPKYRMFHISNHPDGCYLMANNMLARKDELFLNIQQKGSSTLFDEHPDYSQSIENKWHPIDTIKETVQSFVRRYSYQVPIEEFYAEFFSECGLICEIILLREILTEMSHNGELEILRIPHQTMYGKPTAFWTTSKNNQIFIKSLLH